MVDLHITGRLLIGMDKKLKPVALCLYTLAHKLNRELIWFMAHHNNSRARWVLLSSIFDFIGMKASLL